MLQLQSGLATWSRVAFVHPLLIEVAKSTIKMGSCMQNNGVVVFEAPVRCGMTNQGAEEFKLFSDPGI